MLVFIVSFDRKINNLPLALASTISLFIFQFRNVSFPRIRLNQSQIFRRKTAYLSNAVQNATWSSELHLDTFCGANVHLSLALLLGETKFRLAWSCTRSSRGHGSGELRSSRGGWNGASGWGTGRWAIGDPAVSSQTYVSRELVLALLGSGIPLASATRIIVALLGTLVIAKGSASATLFFGIVC